MINILVNRIEQHQVNKRHPMYNMCDELCFKAKNLYNYANYIQRQEFINSKQIYKGSQLDKMLQSHELYKNLGSQPSQRLLKQLDNNWKSFFISIKDWSRNPSKYLGRPKLPRYKDKNGRFMFELKNINFRIEDGYLYFAFKPLKPFNSTIKTNINGNKLLQLRIIPRCNIYVLEIVYEKQIKDIAKESKNIVGIDLGLNNFATLSNNVGALPIVINGRGIKSYNQYWNKQIAKYKSLAKTNNKLDWTKRLSQLTTKRNNKISCFMHKTSKEIINYCLSLNIDTVVIGLNKEWKQESKLSSKVNQSFVQIPYDNFIQKLKYKCEDNGIKFILTEEFYTSGTSFLDNELPIKENYNKNRRIKRGLFKSNNGILINADLNGSYQIIKKVFPNAFANGIVGVDLHPVVINV